jgi:AraC-like DNA-binding protein
MDGFTRIVNGRQTWHANASVPRHRHEHAYAAIVLAGSYEESGSGGRHRVGPADVLLHGAFDAHLDRIGGGGAVILNLALPGAAVRGTGAGRIRDPDVLVRLAAADPEAAQFELFAQFSDAARTPRDWPDLLAADLLDDPALRLGAWARSHGLATETLSRGFRRLYGVTPAAFRAEVRARRAFEGITRSDIPLAALAAGSGHADQSHMTRAVKALTGASPRHWRRRSSGFKTTGGSAD